MIIQCPDCGFARELDENKIPASAKLATCPKCKTKFPFRDSEILEEPVVPLVEQPVEEPMDAPVAQSAEEPVEAPRYNRQYAAEADESEQDMQSSALYTQQEEAPAEPDEYAANEYANEYEQVPEAEPLSGQTPEPVHEYDHESAVEQGAGPEAGSQPSSAYPAEEPEQQPFQNTPEAGPERDLNEQEDTSAAVQSSPEQYPQEPEQQPHAPEEELDVVQGLADSQKAERRQQASSASHADDEEETDIWGRLESLDDEPQPMGRRQAARTYETMDTPSEAEVPWEALERYGFFGGLVQTIYRVLRYPGLLFETMPVGSGIGRPLVFAILMNLIGALFMYIWNVTGINEMAGLVNPDAAEPRDFLLELVMTPFMGVAAQFIFSGAIHFWLYLFGVGKRGFEATFRVLAYSNATAVFFVFPFLGPFVSALFTIFIELVGLRHIHRTTFLRVALAFVLSVVLVGIALIAIIMGMAVAGSMAPGLQG